MHPLLLRQLREAGLEAHQPPRDAASWQAFLSQIDRAYQAAGQKIQLSQAEDGQYKIVLESISDGVCAFDQNGKLMLLNAAARTYLEFGDEQVEAENLLGRFRMRDPWQPDLYLGNDTLLEILTQGGVLRDTDAHLRQEGGRQLPISCAINPLVRQQHVYGAVLVFRDNSAQKATEMELIAAKDAAEKASAAKSDFLSAMSHELRTPMNAILGYAELLKDDLSAGEVDENGIEDLNYYTAHILEAGQSLLGLINQVLDLSRIESGKIQISADKVDLVTVVEECAQQVMAEIKAAGLVLENRLRGLAPVYVLADQSRVRQVVLNLLSNAIKFNRPDGQITLELAEAEDNPQCARLLVKDSGIGMTPEQQEQVFKPFVRMSGKNLSKGTGVGLTVVKELLDIMEGRIGVASQPGEGSTFWIDLPALPARGTLDGEPLPGARKYLLLYVEDSRTNVSLVTKILRVRPDIGFISAPTGELGVELARAHHPDIILLDINLPGIDGFEVLRRLRACEETRNIPVLGLSADDTLEALQQAKAAGFYHYIVKPLEKNTFLENLDQAIQPGR
jgi:signal transduction histidine kinase